MNVHALLATGVNADGYRQILGLHVTSAENGAGWLGFFRDLTARGLSGVALVAGADAQGDQRWRDGSSMNMAATLIALRGRRPSS